MGKTVLVWNEFEHEHTHDEVKEVYPKGIHAALADAISACPEFDDVRTATLRDPNQGLDVFSCLCIKQPGPILICNRQEILIRRPGHIPHMNTFFRENFLK